MNDKPQGKPTFPPLVIPEDLKPNYSNLARISHTPSELILDFSALLPGAKPEVVSRVLMSPVAAKMFFRALGENLARYESIYGQIQMPNTNSGLAQSLFKNVHPPEKQDSSGEDGSPDTPPEPEEPKDEA